MIADTLIASETSLVLARRFKAPPERVFDAWLDPAQLRRFFFTDRMVLGEVWVDARVGGRFHLDMIHEGQSRPHVGHYEVIERPRRLVFTWSSHATDGDSRVSLTFEPRGDETLLTLRHDRLPDAARTAMHVKGWSHFLGTLDALVGAPAAAEDFTLAVDLAGSPAEAYRALTTRAGIAAWWTPHCRIEERVGGEIQVRFPRAPFSAQLIVAALEPDRLVAWTCLGCSHPPAAGYRDRDDWAGTRIRFELTAQGSGTRLAFTHTGLLALECREACEKGWNFFLRQSLRDLLASGKGQPAEA